MKYLLNCRKFISLMVLFSFFDNFGMEKHDYMFKVVFVGDDTVGKTQIINKFVNNKFLEEYFSTIGVNYATKVVEIKNKKIKLQLWDTAGQERFRSITRTYLKGSRLIVLVYAIDNKNSFENIQNLVDEAKTQNKDAKFLLVGNKLDLEEGREVSTEDAKKYAEENNIGFIEVSAKTGDGIDDMFNSSLSKLLEEENKAEENISKNINEFNNGEKNSSLNINDNQYKNDIKINKTSCWSEYCSCCPCLQKSEGNVKNIEPVIF